MGKLSTLGAAFAFAGLLFTVSADAAPSAAEPTNLLNRAAATVEHMKVDPGFGPAQSRVNEAKAMYIVPSLVKGGFIFGAEGGAGVLMANNGGQWSDPAFYNMGSASFGLQAGLEQTEVVMLIMSDRALQSITRGQFKFGADAGLTVVSLSAGAGAATPANLSGDILIWTSGKGLYGGLTLNGSVINSRDDWNTAFYGRPTTVADILSGRAKATAPNPIRQQLAAR
jgi:lipid-binding SYLF domain-containing protein